MADHTVTIKSGCVPDPQTIGGPLNPIFTGDTVHFVNQAGVVCELRFSPPSPFGKPTINVPLSGTQDTITGVVRTRTSFPYTCSAQTPTASPAASATASLTTGGDPGDGIIIVDPPGTGGPGGSATIAPQTTAKRKATAKPKSKAAAKKKSSSSSKTRAKAKPKSKGKAKGKRKGKSKSRARKKH